MLQITIPETELYNNDTQEFIPVKEQVLQLEHSLVSLSKWESKWCKAFLSKKEKTFEETVDYIKCMTITQNVKPEVYNCLTNDNIIQINKYIEAPMTATYIPEDKKATGSRDVVTAELIYYWMITLGIPFECQKWHLNRLLSLIKVCNVKNSPNKNMSKSELLKRHAAINAARRSKHKSRR